MQISFLSQDNPQKCKGGQSEFEEGGRILFLLSSAILIFIGQNGRAGRKCRIDDNCDG